MAAVSHPESFKLTYFDSRGRAEVVRLLFAAAGVQYEDKRVTREEFQAAKAAGEYTYGQLPVLEVDGKMLPQSAAIARYLARKFGLLGADEFETAQVDATAEELKDLMQKLMTAFFATEDKENKIKEAFAAHVPHYLGELEKQAEATGTGYLVGDKASLADITLLIAWDYIKPHLPEEATKPFPNLLKVIEKTGNVPGIKDWIERRPKTAI